MQRTLMLACAVIGLALTGSTLLAQTTAKDAARFAEMLKSDKDAEKRIFAARELASIAKIKVAYLQPHTALLVKTLQQDSDPLVRAAAGTTLLAFAAEPKEVLPAIAEIVKNDKEPGPVLAVAARLAAAYQAKDLIPDLQMLKKREEAKEDPKLRDQRLLQAVNQAIAILSK
jgi:hypothetical protein